MLKEPLSLLKIIGVSIGLIGAMLLIASTVTSKSESSTLR